MLRVLSLIGLMCLFSDVIFSQGTVRGKVTDDLGETVIGATIVLKNNPGTGTVTDFDGNYSLQIKSTEPVTLLVSFIGFQSQEATVNPTAGEVIIRNFDLVAENFEMNEVVIEAKANRAGDFYMEKVKMNAATSIDYISSETIRKIGDSNVSSAVKRVTGVSTVGNFVTVRGLADRYILTTINGNRIPTLDPFTNNLRLDIFPTGLVDNLVVTKTGDPALPGDWSGAYISVETKDYPDKFTLSVKSSFGYNDQSTGKEILTSRGSETDWLGFDNGYRDIPDGVPRLQEDFPRYNGSPNLYQQFEFLGLGDYLNQFGITENTTISSGDAFHQLGLIELDFMGAAEFGNTSSVNQAIADYKEEYSLSFFRSGLNSELEDIGRSFNNNNWFAISEQAPINFSQNISIGDQTKLFGKTLGIVGGLRYSSDYRYDPEASLNRTTQGDVIQVDGRDSVPAIVNLDQELSRVSHSLSGLLKLSYKLNSNNSVSLMFMPNLFGQNSVRRYAGQNENTSGNILIFGDDQFYEERQQFVYQYKSEHYFPGSGIKIDVDGSFSDGQRNVLDFKDTRYILDQGILQFDANFNPDRRYRYMEDDMIDTRISVEIPVTEDKRRSKLFVGGGYNKNDRQNEQVVYRLRGLSGNLIEGSLEDEFNEENFVIGSDQGQGYYYTASVTELGSDIGFRDIYAFYVKSDHQFNERFRTVGGVRVEYTDIYQDILGYYERGLPVDSPERESLGPDLANPADKEEWSILPSINIIYKLQESKDAPFNIRASYFRSIARPSFRELSPLNLFDFELRGRVGGDPNLRISQIDNFDLRLEKYTESNSLFSVTIFYKEFKDHIELIAPPGGDNFTWQNVPESYAAGVEFEAKLDLIENLEFRGNLSLITSETTVTEPVKETRPMFGQAPYIVNLMFTYDFEELGLLATASYNVQGPKLAVVAGAGDAAPNIFELPRNVVDINLNKKLGEHFSVGFKIRDLINNPVRRAYDFDEGYLLDFSSVRWGTIYQFNVSYNI
jgi:hypothetical protein